MSRFDAICGVITAVALVLTLIWGVQACLINRETAKILQEMR